MIRFYASVLVVGDALSFERLRKTRERKKKSQLFKRVMKAELLSTLDAAATAVRSGNSNAASVIATALDDANL